MVADWKPRSVSVGNLDALFHNFKAKSKVANKMDLEYCHD